MGVANLVHFKKENNKYQTSKARGTHSIEMDIKLYFRYIDDGQKFLHPIKTGWRWIGEELRYTRRWDLQDQSLSPIQLTIRTLEDSMKNIPNYLRFTYETGDDFQHWIPAY